MFGGFKGSFFDNFLVNKINIVIHDLNKHITAKASAQTDGHVKLNYHETISEPGTYALDAVQGNPNIQGTLAHEVAEQNTNLINKIYPIGSIYMSVNNVSPVAFIGGAWEPLKDRFLLGAGESFNVNSAGGEVNHTLTVNELPANFPSERNFLVDSGSISAIDMGISMGAAPAGSYKAIINYIQRGGGQAHNNMPPYLAVYMWKRTA